MIKKIATILASISGFILATAGIATTLNAKAQSSYGDAFIYGQEAQMKYKAVYTDMSVSNEKGMLFYAYDSGAKADFKGVMNDTFETSLAVLAEEGKTADLANYSLLFTDKATGDSFSIGVSTGKDESNVYVQVNGEKAGIVYYYSEWASPQPYGYTGLYNSENIYTVIPSNLLSLRFNPRTMKVEAADESGVYYLVWDFSQEYNDGKRLDYDMRNFGSYSVSVVFDEVKKNGKGELLVYSFGGHKFDTQYVDSKPNVSATIVSKAIVGETYDVPKATVSDLLLGEISSANVVLKVYNEVGEIVNEDNAYSFTPDQKGEYYLYYTYGEDENLASAYYCVEAIEESDISYSFTYEENLQDEQTIGRYTRLYIPSANVSTTLSHMGVSKQASVTMLKDSVEIEGYKAVEGGFEYVFSEEGEYTLLYSVPEYGNKVKEAKTIIVSAEKVGVLVEEIEEVLPLGETINISPAKIYFNGEEETAEVSIISPSGKTVNGTQAIVDEIGDYTINHTWSGGIETQTFTVMQLYENIFTAGKGNSVSYQTMTANNQVTGQMLTLTNNTQVVYDKVIDLSDNTFDDTISDRTQNEPLLEFIVQPNEIGKADMTALYITFTDIYDPENYISVRIKYMDYNPAITLLRTRATGQNWLAYHYEFMTGDVLIHNATSHEDGGLVSSANFTQTIDSRHFVDNSMKLYYDDNALSIYAQSWQTVSGDGTKEIPFLLRDYSTTDQFLSGGDKPWRGWTTGEVRMTIYAVGVSSTANVMLMKIDGEDLSNPYVPDTAAPIISFTDLAEENNPPKAEVDTPYKLFDAKWRDLYSAVVKENVSVYFGNSLVDIVDGAFTPNQIGTYSIVYTAWDSYGNTAQKTVLVEAISLAEKPTITLLEELTQSAVVGQRVYLPEFIGEGGVGGVTTSVQVTCGGEPIEVEYGSFVCDREGTYTIRLIATDYIGSQGTQTLRIRNVVLSDMPVFDEREIVLPETFIQGDTYTFPNYQADYYTSVNSSEKIAVKIEVTDANGINVINGKYTPKASDTVSASKIRYIFAKGDKETIIERNVPIKVIKNKVAQYLTQYYTYQNAEISAVKEGIFFTATNDTSDMKFAFVRPIAENQLFFRLAVDKEKANYRSMNVIFRDSANVNQVVIITIEEVDGEYKATVGGVSKFFSIEDDGKMEFSYDISTHTFTDVFDRRMCVIETYENGAKFEGFTSGCVYLEVEVNEIYGEASVGMASIANQIMNNNRQDTANPIISLNGYLSGSFAPGTAITIPTAQAYDVLGYVGDVQVTVLFNGQIVQETALATKEHIYILGEQYGEYAIEYTVQDTNGRLATLTRYVVAYDETKPSLHFNGSIATTAELGSKIILPTYTVSDNGKTENVKVEIYVMSPNGLISDVKNNTISFTRVGKYVIYYQVQDENGNVAFYSFDIIVD